MEKCVKLVISKKMSKRSMALDVRLTGYLGINTNLYKIFFISYRIC